MNNVDALVGWSDDQWNQLRQVVSTEAHKARVAASLLPTEGPLSPSTQVVPSDLIQSGGRVNDTATITLITLDRPVVLSQQQLAEEDLSSALLAFGRAATEVARVEDQIIFMGKDRWMLPLQAEQPPKRGVHQMPDMDGYATDAAPDTNVYGRVNVIGGAQDEDYLATDFNLYVEPNLKSGTLLDLPAFRDGFEYLRLKATNPGGLGLVTGAGANQDVYIGVHPRESSRLVENMIQAIGKLEDNEYLAPFVCVLGNRAFGLAHTPMGESAVLPSDLIEPFLGSQILRSSAILNISIPNTPTTVLGYGVIVSLAGDAVDLAVALDPSPQFLNITDAGQYHFRVVERFALRIKDPRAVLKLTFIHHAE